MLTVLQERLGEAHGLAMAAPTVIEHVQQRTGDSALFVELRRLREDADDARARCLSAERAFEPARADEILAHANTIKERAGDVLRAWFKAGTGPLAAWSFLAMAEAAEVATWSALARLGRHADHDGIGALAVWGLPIQEGHLHFALDGTVRLAEVVDPHAERWG